MSPTCECDFYAACARSVEIAAAASVLMLLCGSNTGHSCKPQRTPYIQGSSCGRSCLFLRLRKGPFRCKGVGPIRSFSPVTEKYEFWPVRRLQAKRYRRGLHLHTLLDWHSSPTSLDMSNSSRLGGRAAHPHLLLSKHVRKKRKSWPSGLTSISALRVPSSFSSFFFKGQISMA